MEIYYSPSLKFTIINSVNKFFQQMANRLAVGQARYGQPQRGAGWMTRARKELSAYERTGNVEHLINLANYAFLEQLLPENPNHHFDNKAKSATRRGDA